MKLSTEVIVRTPENFPRMKISSTVCCRFSPLDRATVEIHLPRSTFHSFAIFVPNVTEAFPESSTAHTVHRLFSLAMINRFCCWRMSFLAQKSRAKWKSRFSSAAIAGSSIRNSEREAPFQRWKATSSS